VDDVSDLGCVVWTLASGRVELGRSQESTSGAQDIRGVTGYASPISLVAAQYAFAMSARKENMANFENMAGSGKQTFLGFWQTCSVKSSYSENLPKEMCYRSRNPR
jgi:hypothetical protein